MKYIDEFRDPAAVRRLAAAIQKTVTRPWTLMEVCGGQTHAIVRFGLDGLFPKNLTLIHGPGCPVCVTPIGLIDTALALAKKKEVTLCTFGDMLRVPGSREDLLSVKAGGGDVRSVYSPSEALELAQKNPDKQVVFFAVGFETTAPTTAWTVHQAKKERVPNFSLLVAHVLVPPAIETILSSPGNRVQGFLAAGHVCTVMGESQYRPLARKYKVPIVVTGFEPVDILEGVLGCVRQLEQGRHDVENQYERTARSAGNQSAQKILDEVFEPSDRAWRGIGNIPTSGLRLRSDYRAFDAELRFGTEPGGEESPECKSGLVLRGEIRPFECPAFGSSCTPDRPLGAPMVSSEGACAAYYRYRAPVRA